MKLLICASEYFPHGSGIANVVYNVVEQLKKQGVECTVCSPTGPDIYLGSQKLIEKTGIIGLLYFWYCVRKNLKENTYDVFWLHNPFLLRTNLEQKCIVTMHSTYYGESRHHVGTSLFLKFYKKIASILEKHSLISMNKHTLFTGVGLPVCIELEKMGIEKKRISYIPNGVNIQKFSIIPDKTMLRNKFGIPINAIVLLSVGRLTPAKRPHLLIDMFTILEKKTKNVTLCIAGAGELLDSTIEYTHRKPVKNVIFLGHVDYQHDLSGLYACSDYYIISSIYEGGMPPLTLAEAMASGLPCIVSDIPNFKAVKDADCGIIVNFDNAELASNEICQYLTDNVSDHATNAREYALRFLGWENISKEYLKKFQTLNN